MNKIQAHSEFLLRTLRTQNPDLIYSGSQEVKFPFPDDIFSFHLTYLSIWDPLSVPRGIRFRNEVLLLNNTFFASIADHLSQILYAKHISPDLLDFEACIVGVFKKSIADAAYRLKPSKTSVAFFTETLFEYEGLNLEVYRLIKSHPNAIETLTSVAGSCASIAAGHELSHFLFDNVSFRDKVFPDLSDLQSSVGEDLAIEIFCDTVGCVYSAIGCANSGFDFDSTMTILKIALFGSLFTLFCQALARNLIVLNEPEHGWIEVNLQIRYREIFNRYEYAIARSMKILRSEWPSLASKGTSSIPFSFSLSDIHPALKTVSDYSCRDVGIRRISSLFADAFSKVGYESFRHVASNAHQITKIDPIERANLKA